MIIVINDMPYAVVVKKIDDDLAGRAEPDVCEIQIQEGHALPQQIRTLFHEIIHIILDQTGHVKLADNEDLVNALAFGIVSVLAHNPILAVLAKGEMEIDDKVYNDM